MAHRLIGGCSDEDQKDDGTERLARGRFAAGAGGNETGDNVVGDGAAGEDAIVDGVVGEDAIVDGEAISDVKC